MSIDAYTLKDGSTRYRATTYVNGQRVQKRGFAKKKDAKQWIERVRVEGKAPASAITYGEAEALFLESYELAVAGSTYYDMMITLRKHVPGGWRHRRLASISVTDVQALANDLARRYAASEKTTNRIKQVFDFAEKQKLLKDNPFDSITMPRSQVEKVEKEIWTEAQMLAFLRTCKESNDARLYPCFRLLLITGLRRSELIGLEWSDYNPDALTLSIRCAIVKDSAGHTIKGGPKYDSRRVIGIDRETGEVLNSYRELCTSPRMFPVSSTTIWNWMNKASDAAGLPRSHPHALRSYHCTELLRAGVPLKDVQDRLGHKSAATTLQAYAKANKDKHAALSNFNTEKYDI